MKGVVASAERGKGAAQGSSQRAKLRIAATEAAPWPAMKVAVQVLLGSGAVPLSRVRMDGGALVLKHALAGQVDAALRTDPLDALLLRSILQQPLMDENHHLVPAREFAPILALLRQHSSACEYDEAERIAAVQIQGAAPELVLEVKAVPLADGTPDPQRVMARGSFRSSDDRVDLGEPLYRGASYWTFARAITPPPELPSDALLRRTFESATALEFTGSESLDLIQRAKAAANSDELLVRMDGSLATLNVNVLPLKERTRVAFNAAGDLEIQQELLTPDGQSVPEEALAGDASGDWVNVRGRAYRLPQAAAHFRLPRKRTLQGDQIGDFLKEELPKLQASGAALDPSVATATVCEALRPSLRIDADGDDAVKADFSFALPQNDVKITPEEMLTAAQQGLRYLRRGNTFVPVNREAVRRCRKELERVAGDGDFRAADDNVPELLAWAKKAAGDVVSPWNIYVAEAVDGAHKIKDDAANVRLSLDVEEEEDGTWFTLNATFDHDGEALSEDELRKLVRQGKKWFRKNGAWVKVDAEALERFELSVQQSGVKRRFGRRRKFYYRFRPEARERVTDIFSLSGTVEHADRYKRFLAQLKGFDRIEQLPLPAGMALSLRPYQQQGFEWLTFLTRYGLNGILADDMGLGKTAQTIALLTQLKNEEGPAPALIVTPTSLVDNWRKEFEKFSPGMRVMAYRGSPGRRDRLRQRISSDFDVVLGTYAMVRNDASLLRTVDWRCVILDEAHFIKNSAAATTKAIKTIPAKHRVALTGTPIQNRLTELWSLFDFLMPEFLGRQMRFRENFEEPIARMQSGRAETRDEQKNGEQALEHLKERIRPFVLRRLKTDVASELPPKIENDIFCRLSPEQVALYKSFSDSAEAKDAVNELITKGADRACTAILAALTSLRKICNHADLMVLPKNQGRQRIAAPLPGYETRSGKLEALGELLQQCREGGHRALIFCQLTSMLDLLGHFLAQHGMNYLRLDGETPAGLRQGLVERFNSDSGLDAFLISTRAGGTGLNLTGADTVIFYDHDWNPANDSQAQDRAYRIGQKRTVNVYRLICKGTLEEKILRRQALKKLLANSIVQHDMAGMKDLTREELLSLFTFSEEPDPSREC